MAHPARVPLVLSALLALAPVAEALAGPVSPANLIGAAVVKVADVIAEQSPLLRANSSYVHARSLASAGDFEAADRALWAADEFDAGIAQRACDDAAFDDLFMADLRNAYLDEACYYEEGC